MSRDGYLEQEDKAAELHQLLYSRLNLILIKHGLSELAGRDLASLVRLTFKVAADFSGEEGTLANVTGLESARFVRERVLCLNEDEAKAEEEAKGSYEARKKVRRLKLAKPPRKLKLITE